MKRILVVLVLLLAVTAWSDIDEQKRVEFLGSYYAGDYKKAHDLLAAAYSDDVTREIWENRIHLHDDLPNCPAFKSSRPSAHAIALLRSGDLEGARQSFQNDWLGLYGLATCSYWSNDMMGARN